MCRLTRILPIVLLFSAFLVAPVAASSYPTVVSIPDDFQPEGIAVADHTFYVSSLRDGDIYRGDLRSGDGEIFVDNTGRASVGLRVDRRHGLLLVAGGPYGSAQVYDLRTGALEADVFLGAGLINDVAVTPDAAYFTNTFAPELYRLPIAPDGSVGTPETITVTGPAGGQPQGFGLNGIVVTPGGGLIVNYTDTGGLFTIDPATGVSAPIAVSGGSLAPGVLDGLLLVGHELWAVENGLSRVTILQLSPDWSSAVVTDVVTHPAFHFPTTVARHGDRLAVVNGKFDLGFPPPFGPGAPPGTPFEVVQVPTR